MIKIFCDGGSRGNPGCAASAFVVVGEDSKIVEQNGKYIGTSTNNVAEYTAVLEAMTWLLKQNFKEDTVVFYLDSQLIVNQLIGTYKIKDSKLAAFAIQIKKLQNEFLGKIIYKNIPREENKIADTLVNQTLDKEINSENSNSKCV